MQGSHFPYLDGFRAICVFGVLWSHWLPPSFQAGVPWGHFGVQAFFVLSGFLITRVLRERHNRALISTIRFYQDRFLRIGPAFYSILAVAIVLNLLDTRREGAWHALFLTNVRIWWENSYSLSSHFWTLAVEIQFYLVWPWVVLWTSKPAATTICCVLLLCAPLIRAMGPQIFPHLEWTVLLPSDFDAFIAGALAAVVPAASQSGRTICAMRTWLFLPLFLILQGVASTRGLSLSVESLRHFAMVMALSGFVSAPEWQGRTVFGRFLALPLLRDLGVISYGIYLMHAFVPEILGLIQIRAGASTDYLQGLSPSLRFLIYCVITVGAAAASWHVVERPILRWRRVAAGRRAGEFADATCDLGALREKQ